MVAGALPTQVNNKWLLVGLVIICLVMALAYPSLQHAANSARTSITAQQYHIASDDQQSLEQVMQLPDQQWQSMALRDHSLGMDKRAYWFKFEIPPGDDDSERLLSLNYPLIDNIALWFTANQQVLRHFQTGDSLPFAQRIIPQEQFVFPLPDSNEALTVYLQVQTSGALELPLNLWTEVQWLAYSNQHNFVMGAFFGLLLAMLASNLFFFMSTRSRIFIIYCGYVSCLGMSLATLHGLAYQHIWPELPWLQQHALPIFANLSMAFFVMFCDLLLNIQHYSQRFSRALKLLALIYLLSVVVSLVAPLHWLMSAFFVMLLISSIFIYALGVWLWTKGNGLAAVYTLAWTILFLSALIVCLNNLNLLHIDLPFDYLMVLGAAIDTLLLALVMAINYGQQRRQLLDAQQQLLATTLRDKDSQQALLLAQQQAQEDLEYKVQERTLELEIALRELSETNRELQEKTTIDALTGIRNRSYFDKKYIAELRRSRRECTHLSLAMLDIDHFKKINDSHGHMVGDQCIKIVANKLKQALKRPSDDVCRYGGEEFVLILPNTELDGALLLLEQLRAEIERSPITTEGLTIPLTISAGVACTVVTALQAEESLLGAADQQLYQAKKAGRNNIKGVYLAEHAEQFSQE